MSIWYLEQETKSHLCCLALIFATITRDLVSYFITSETDLISPVSMFSVRLVLRSWSAQIHMQEGKHLSQLQVQMPCVL